MISSFLPSSPISAADFIVSLLAGSGAAIILWGLWWEEYGEKPRFSDINDLRKSKRKAHWGRKLVLAGVLWEMVVGIGVAAYDAWEMEQIGGKTPAKMPVSSVAATAVFWVETNRDDPNLIIGPPESAAILVLAEKPNEKASTNELRLTMTCETAQARLYMTNERTAENLWQITLHFVMEPMNEASSAKALAKTAEELQRRMKFFLIYPNWLDGNTVKIFSGKVTFVLNGPVSKTLLLPPQTVDLNPLGPHPELNQFAARQNATNSLGIPAKWFISNF